MTACPIFKHLGEQERGCERTSNLLDRKQIPRPEEKKEKKGDFEIPLNGCLARESIEATGNFKTTFLMMMFPSAEVILLGEEQQGCENPGGSIGADTQISCTWI